MPFGSFDIYKNVTINIGNTCLQNSFQKINTDVPGKKLHWNHSLVSSCFRIVFVSAMFHREKHFKFSMRNVQCDLLFLAVKTPKPLKNRDFVLQRSWLDTGREYLIINHSVNHAVSCSLCLFAPPPLLAHPSCTALTDLVPYWQHTNHDHQKKIFKRLSASKKVTRDLATKAKNLAADVAVQGRGGGNKLEGGWQVKKGKWHPWGWQVRGGVTFPWLVTSWLVTWPVIGRGRVTGKGGGKEQPKASGSSSLNHGLLQYLFKCSEVKRNSTCAQIISHGSRCLRSPVRMGCTGKWFQSERPLCVLSLYFLITFINCPKDFEENTPEIFLSLPMKRNWGMVQKEQTAQRNVIVLLIDLPCDAGETKQKRINVCVHHSNVIPKQLVHVLEFSCSETVNFRLCLYLCRTYRSRKVLCGVFRISLATGSCRPTARAMCTNLVVRSST